MYRDERGPARERPTRDMEAGEGGTEVWPTLERRKDQEKTGKVDGAKEEEG